MSDTNNGHGTELSQAVAQPMQGRPMMIKNLVPSLPERGKIKIGKKGPVRKSNKGTEFQIPQKLDHFLITTLQRGPDNNYLLDEGLHKIYGEKPKELPIRLLYDDPALNFPTRYAAYNGQKLWCAGDGETASRLNDDGKGRKMVQCPCHRKEPGYNGTDKCKMNGSLSVLIEGAGGVGGVWKFRSTSYNSIVGMMSSMAFIRSVTGGPLANIPLVLAVQPKQVADPAGNPQTVYVTVLEFRGTVNDLQKEGHQIALDRATTHLSIQHIEAEARRLLLPPPDDAPLPGDDPDDVREEFYPGEHIDEDGVVHEGEVIQNGTKPLGKLDKLDQILEGNATQVTEPAATQTKAPAEPAQPKQDAKPAAEPKTPAPTGDPIFDEAAAIAAKGTAAFNAWWNGEGKALVPGVEKTKRLLINDRKDKLKEIAAAADARPVTVPQDVADEPSDVDDEGEAETQTQTRTSGAGEDIEAGFEEMVKDLQACTALADVNILSEKNRGFIVGLQDNLRSRWAIVLNAKTAELSKVKR